MWIVSILRRGGREIPPEFNISSNSKNQNTALGGATQA